MMRQAIDRLADLQSWFQEGVFDTVETERFKGDNKLRMLCLHAVRSTRRMQTKPFFSSFWLFDACFAFRPPIAGVGESRCVQYSVLYRRAVEWEELVSAGPSPRRRQPVVPLLGLPCECRD